MRAPRHRRSGTNGKGGTTIALKTVTASAPARIDLAGGTLDIWPLYLLLRNPVTVNLAIDRRAVARVAPRRDGRVVLKSRDTGETVTGDDLQSAARADGLPLLRTIVRHMCPDGGFALTTSSGVPPGSGLGGSSALTVAALHALSLAEGTPICRDELLPLARDLEAKVLGIPTGMQDHIAAVRGGLLSIEPGPGRIVHGHIPVDPGFLTRRLVLAIVGASRLSGDTNWRMLRNALDGRTATLKRFREIAEAAFAMRDALRLRDIDAAAAAMAREYEARRGLAKGVETDEMRAVHGAALDAGALAGKVCGAGGGGAMVFLVPQGRKGIVTAAVAAAGARVLKVRADTVGLAGE